MSPAFGAVRPVPNPTAVRSTQGEKLSVIKTWSGPNSLENLDGLAHSLKGVVNGSDGRLPCRELGRRQGAEAAVRSHVTGLMTPCLDRFARLRHARRSG